MEIALTCTLTAQITNKPVGFTVLGLFLMFQLGWTIHELRHGIIGFTKTPVWLLNSFSDSSYMMSLA